MCGTKRGDLILLWICQAVRQFISDLLEYIDPIRRSSWHIQILILRIEYTPLNFQPVSN